MGYRLGIDLGTTFTAAAYIEDAGPRMLELGRRQVSMPSIMLVNEDGSLLIGEAAERRSATEPDRVIREFKRRFGDDVPFVVAGHAFTPVELQTEMLRWVLDNAEQRRPPVREHVVVTHPANWGPYKLRCLREMLASAGVTGATLCAEPVAAAIDFASSREVPDDANLVIYDLGGGTFDVAVVAKSDDGFRVLGTPLGDEHLGGSDFDEAVVIGTLERLGLHDFDVDDPDVARGLIALRRECVEAKEALSTEVSTQISSLLPGAVRRVQFNRREFEELIRYLLDASVATTRRALRLAGVEIADLHAVVLVGGSSQIPLVTELLTRELGVPVILSTSPKNTIALGAALHARFTEPSTDPMARPAGPSLPEPIPPTAPPEPIRQRALPPTARQPTPATVPPAAGGVASRSGNDPLVAGDPHPPVSPLVAIRAFVTTGGDDSRRRPSWMVPVSITTVLALVIAGTVLFIRRPSPEPGAAPNTTTLTEQTPSVSPSASASPSSPASPSIVPGLPSGPPISKSVVLVPMRTTREATAPRRLHLIDTTKATRTMVLGGDRGTLTNPTVQPSRTTIVVRRDFTLWMMSSQGRDGRRLARKDPGGCRTVVGVSWSQVDPNVLVIACQLGKTNRQRLRVIDIKGNLIRDLPAGKLRIGDDVTISPNGRLVLYWASTTARGDGGALYTVRIDGTGGARRITTGANGSDGDPAWSPDGRQIAFRRLPNKGSADSDVFVMDANGSRQRKVSDFGADDMKPVWSPDGKFLLIVSNRRSARGSEGKDWGLWLLGAQDGKVIRQIGRTAPEITTPTWLYR
jgi:actin-like ATPase involved in cell morphogenesis